MDGEDMAVSSGPPACLQYTKAPSVLQCGQAGGSGSAQRGRSACLCRHAPRLGPSRCTAAAYRHSAMFSPQHIPCHSTALPPRSGPAGQQQAAAPEMVGKLASGVQEGSCLTASRSCAACPWSSRCAGDSEPVLGCVTCPACEPCPRQGCKHSAGRHAALRSHCTDVVIVSAGDHARPGKSRSAGGGQGASPWLMHARIED